MEKTKIRQIDNWENIGNAAIDNPLLFLLLLGTQFILEQLSKIKNQLWNPIILSLAQLQ